MNYQTNLSEISEKVKNLGVIKKENWLDQEDIKKTKSIIEKINCTKGNNDGIFSLNLFPSPAATIITDEFIGNNPFF